MLQRILKGDPGKESRWRDFEGRLPPPLAWPYIFASVASTLHFKLTGARAWVPWLGYRARRRIARILAPGSRVLEFGAGLSTIWFARRGMNVLSVEAHEEWKGRVEQWLTNVPGHRAHVVLSAPPYAADLFADQDFDFALVDGDDRDSAMRVALSRVRLGGYVYLDNADVRRPSHRAARDLLLARGQGEWFTDFTPFQVFVSTGLLVRKVR